MTHKGREQLLARREKGQVLHPPPPPGPRSSARPASTSGLAPWEEQLRRPKLPASGPYLSDRTPFQPGSRPPEGLGATQAWARILASCSEYLGLEQTTSPLGDQGCPPWKGSGAVSLGFGARTRWPYLPHCRQTLPLTRPRGHAVLSTEVPQGPNADQCVAAFPSIYGGKSVSQRANWAS